MEIHLIFATVNEDPEFACAVDVWDEYSMEVNYDGYAEALSKARENHGPENVRVVRAELDRSVVARAWQIPSGTLSNAEPVTD